MDLRGLTNWPDSKGMGVTVPGTLRFTAAVSLCPSQRLVCDNARGSYAFVLGYLASNFGLGHFYHLELFRRKLTVVAWTLQAECACRMVAPTSVQGRQ